MKNLAVDIVLLPPEDINRLAVEINKSLNQKEGGINFENGKCLPHISLMMGVMGSGEQSDVQRILESIAKETTPLALTVEALEVHTISGGQSVSGFAVGATKELQNIHEKLLEQLSGVVREGGDEEMFYEPPIREGSIEYLRSFRKYRSFEKFKPHITLGVGAAVSMLKFPIAFTAHTLALGHLGNYNTCRKILFSTELTAS